MLSQTAARLVAAGLADPPRPRPGTTGGGSGAVMQRLASTGTNPADPLAPKQRPAANFAPIATSTPIAAYEAAYVPPADAGQDMPPRSSHASASRSAGPARSAPIPRARGGLAARKGGGGSMGFCGSTSVAMPRPSSAGPRRSASSSKLHEALAAAGLHDERLMAADPASLTPVQRAYLQYLRGERVYAAPASTYGANLHDQAAADAADGADGAVPPPQPPPTQQPMAAFRELDGSSESPAPRKPNFGNTPPAVPSASLRPPSPPPSPHQQMVTLLVPAADLTGSGSARRPKLSQPVSTGRADRRNHLKGSEPTASFGSGRAGYAESWFGDAGQTGALAHQHQLQHQARKGGSATASEWAAIQRERSVAACLHHRESIAEESGQALQLVASVPTMEEGGGRGHGGRSGCGGAAAMAASTATVGHGRPGSPTSYLDGLGSASAPAPTPLTRFDPEDEPMWNLVNAVRESYRIRAEAAVALEQLGRDFSRDFSPAEHPHRRPARSLVIKASNIVSRLQAMGKGLEGAAAIGLRIAQSGASERESIISTLQQELKLLDEDAQRELFSMRRRMEDHAKEVALEMATERALLTGCMGEAEADVGRSIDAFNRATREKEQALLLAEKARQSMMAAEEESARMRRLAEEAGRAREAAEEEGRRLGEALAAEKEGRRRDAQVAQKEMDALAEENQKLRDYIHELEGTGSAAAKKLKNAELEGGNLRALAAAAVDKLEVQTAEMAKLREEMDDLRRTIHAKDAEIAALEERLREMREAMGEVETLKAIIASLQKVLHEAMKAGTWQQCRQILYHESLRYVSTAATHGKAPAVSGAAPSSTRSVSPAPSSTPSASGGGGRRRSMSKQAAMLDGAAIASLVNNVGGNGSEADASSMRSVSPPVVGSPTEQAARGASSLLHAPAPSAPKERDAPRRLKSGR